MWLFSLFLLHPIFLKQNKKKPLLFHRPLLKFFSLIMKNVASWWRVEYKDHILPSNSDKFSENSVKNQIPHSADQVSSQIQLGQCHEAERTIGPDLSGLMYNLTSPNLCRFSLHRKYCWRTRRNRDNISTKSIFPYVVFEFACKIIIWNYRFWVHFFFFVTPECLQDLFVVLHSRFNPGGTQRMVCPKVLSFQSLNSKFFFN